MEVVGAGYQLFSLYALEPLIVLLTGESTDLSPVKPVEGNIFLLSLFLAMVWTLAAFGEELVYRGYLMNRVAELAGGSGAAWAVSMVVVSVLFGALHAYQGITGVVDNILAGLVYGALYLWGGRSLWPPIIAHGVYTTRWHCCSSSGVNILGCDDRPDRRTRQAVTRR